MKRVSFFPRLAWQGIRKNLVLYLPYLLMSVLMVAIHYIMYYLSAPQVIYAMGRGASTQTVMEMGTMVVEVFACIFLYYCNTFLVGRRMREFGLYNVLGMGKGAITGIMGCETLLTAGIAIGGGLLLGVSLARVVELMMIRVLKAELNSGLWICWAGVRRSLTLFGGIYLVILLANMFRMRLSNPRNLLNAEKTGDKPPRANWLLAILGVAALALGYWMACRSQMPTEALNDFFKAVLAVVVGTYLLFIAGSVTGCRLLQKNTRFYYQPRHFISLSSMAFRMKRNGAGLATICILCTMVLVIFTSTLCLYACLEEQVGIVCPANYNVHLEFGAVENENQVDVDGLTQYLVGTVEEEGATVNQAQTLLSLDFMGALAGNDILPSKQNDAMEPNVLNVQVYALQDYTALTGTDIQLGERELLCYSDSIGQLPDSLRIFGLEPFTLRRIDDIPAFFRTSRANEIYPNLIVLAKDQQAVIREVLAGGDPLADVTYSYELFLNVDKGEADVGNCLWEAVYPVMDDLRGSGSGGFRIRNQDEFENDLRGMYGGLFFLGLILGGIFTLAAVLIIFYKQISEGYEDAGRFAMMRKVGLTDEEIRRSINSQVLTAFFAPLGMAGLHLLFAMPLVRLLLVAFGMHNDLLFYQVTAAGYGVFALLYSAVYFITSRKYYQIVR